LPAEDAEEAARRVRPYYPRWHKTKLGLLTLSLLVCAVIFGIGIAMGYHNAPFYDVYSGSYGTFGDAPVDIEFGVSGTAVCFSHAFFSVT
jgi:hypothetical protein